jgi:hypothetical protein
MRRLLFSLILFTSVAAMAQSDASQSKTEAKKPDASATETQKVGESATEKKKAPATAADPNAMPVLDGAIGACSAEFHVTGAGGKPVYGAQIHTLIKYGAFGIRKLDLQISTNVDGKAKFSGLPDVNKRPVFFDIS